MVTTDSATLFINTKRVLPETMAYLKENGVTVREYEEMERAPEEIRTPKKILVDMASLNYDLYTALKKNEAVTVQEGEDTVVPL
ncbi:peptidase M24, partial [Clostridium sp. 2-1]